MNIDELKTLLKDKLGMQELDNLFAGLTLVPVWEGLTFDHSPSVEEVRLEVKDQVAQTLENIAKKYCDKFKDATGFEIKALYTQESDDGESTSLVFEVDGRNTSWKFLKILGGFLKTLI